MKPTPRRSPAWPSASHLRHFAILYALIAVEFVLVFWGADWITAHHSVRIHAYWNFELAIPLVPVMVLPYMTMYAIFLLAPLILRTAAELNRLASALARVIVIGGIGFIAIPAQLGFPTATAEGSMWEPWLRLADRLNLDYDLIPSLHVALFTVCAGAYAPRVPVVARTLLGVWLAAVMASTILTHQHQLIDAVTGLALGAWGAVHATSRPAARRTNPKTSPCSP
jgi:membrane-associated phospholipid phosphatase